MEPALTYRGWVRNLYFLSLKSVSHAPILVTINIGKLVFFFLLCPLIVWILVILHTIDFVSNTSQLCNRNPLKLKLSSIWLICRLHTISVMKGSAISQPKQEGLSHIIGSMMETALIRCLSKSLQLSCLKDTPRKLTKLF